MADQLGVRHLVQLQVVHQVLREPAVDDERGHHDARRLSHNTGTATLRAVPVIWHTWRSRPEASVSPEALEAQKRPVLNQIREGETAVRLAFEYRVAHFQ